MPKPKGTSKPTIEEHLTACGVSRRSFLQLCTTIMVTAPVGMALTEKKELMQVAAAIGKAKRPSVIWLHFQTGRVVRWRTTGLRLGSARQ